MQPAAGVVPGSGRSPLPVLLLGSLAILVLAPLHWAWRRRGPPVSGPTPHPALPSPALLASWTDRGELRADIEGWRLHLESRQRGQSDPAVLALLEELRQARYGPRPDRELTELCRRAAPRAQAGT